MRPNKRPYNKGLEQTGSAAPNGMGRPCSSIQCCAGQEGV